MNNKFDASIAWSATAFSVAWIVQIDNSNIVAMLLGLAGLLAFLMLMARGSDER